MGRYAGYENDTTVTVSVAFAQGPAEILTLSALTPAACTCLQIQWVMRFFTIRWNGSYGENHWRDRLPVITTCPDLSLPRMA